MTVFIQQQSYYVSIYYNKNINRINNFLYFNFFPTIHTYIQPYPIIHILYFLIIIANHRNFYLFYFFY